MQSLTSHADEPTPEDAIALLSERLDPELADMDELGRTVFDFNEMQEMAEAVEVIGSAFSGMQGDSQRSPGDGAMQARSGAGDLLRRLQSADVALASSPSTYDPRARTVEAVVATTAPVERFGVAEILDLTTEAIDLRRAQPGRMPVLFNHDPDRPIGNVLSVRVSGSRLIAKLAFADTDEGRKAEGQVARGELSQFSIGYRVRRWTEERTKAGAMTHTAAEWELCEVSLVSIPADPAAIVRSISPTPKGNRRMDTEDDTITAERVERAALATEAGAVSSRAERRRIADIQAIGRQAGLTEDVVSRAIDEGTPVVEVRAVAFDHLASRHTPASHVRVERCETETRVQGMTAELQRAMSGAARATAPEAERYRGFGFVEMAAELIGHRGRLPSSTGERQDILRRAFHTTSDFPFMVENSMNGRMAARYELATPTYRRLTARRDVPDFKPAPFYRPGDLPALRGVAEGGKIEFGTFGESREVIAVAPFARAFNISRHLMVNDSYRAIEDVIGDYANRVAAFEDSLFWTLVQSASGAGPTLLTTTRPMFNVTDGTLAASGTAITTAAVGLGRAAMRKQRSVDQLFIASEPALIVAGPDNETAVDQLIAAITPNQTSQVNPFSGNLEKVITPYISGNSWYLWANPESVPSWIYSLLDGYTAPRMRTMDDFDSQGLRCKVEHDVGFAGVDFRGAYRNPGA